MKRAYILLLFVCIGLAAHAQQQPDTAVLLRLPADPPNVTRFKQKLVELALQSPDVKQYDDRKEIAKYSTRIATAQWANHFTAAGNLNEFTIKGRNDNDINANQNFYPRYNFGVSFPLGHFVSIPNEIKRAKAEGKLAQRQKESMALVVKAKVLQAYEDYAAAKKLLELHLPVMEDALLNYNQVEEKFRAGDNTVPIDVYKEAYRQYNAEMVQKVELERTFRQTKLALEGFVGMTLEEVMRLP
jgi:outer membrane protein TolC